MKELTQRREHPRMKTGDMWRLEAMAMVFSDPGIHEVMMLESIRELLARMRMVSVVAVNHL